MDNLVSEGIKRGQHLYHISQTNNLGMSKSTIYRHLHKGYLSVSPLDFPHAARFKQQDKKKGEFISKASRLVAPTMTSSFKSMIINFLLG